MTTYSTRLILNDSERIALEAALNYVIANCKFDNSANDLRWAHKQSCESIVKKLSKSDIFLSSSNNFS